MHELILKSGAAAKGEKNIFRDIPHDRDVSSNTKIDNLTMLVTKCYAPKYAVANDEITTTLVNRHLRH